MFAYQMLNSLVAKYIAPVLVENGFARHVLRFNRRSDENCAVIDVQKRVWTTRESVTFTVNIGVASPRLFQFFTPDKLNKITKIEDCHWWLRLGMLFDKREDLWWTLDSETQIEPLGKYLAKVLVEHAIPEINKYATDLDLRDLWLSGKSPHLTEFERLKYLSVLVKQLGPMEHLDIVINELRRISKGKRSEISADVHIETLLNH